MGLIKARKGQEGNYRADRQLVDTGQAKIRQPCYTSCTSNYSYEYIKEKAHIHYYRHDDVNVGVGLSCGMAQILILLIKSFFNFFLMAKTLMTF